MRKTDSKTVAWMGLFLAAALVLGYAESLIPLPFFLPGMKLGLPNLVIFLVLWRLGTVRAGEVSLLRVLLTAATFGNAFSMLYSLAGAVLSLLVMSLLKKAGFHPAAVSAAGGVSHNLGQILVACLVLRSLGAATYLPVLIVSGVVSGALIGILAALAETRLPKDLGSGIRE